MDDLFTYAERTGKVACRPPADPIPDSCIVPAEFGAIWGVLLGHRGAERAITAPDIAVAAQLWPDMAPANRGRLVRKVLDLSQDVWPEPIIGDTDGYYLAQDPDELSHYCAALRGRAMAILKRFASTRKSGRRAGWQYLGRGRWSGKEVTMAK